MVKSRKNEIAETGAVPAVDGACSATGVAKSKETEATAEAGATSQACIKQLVMPGFRMASQLLISFCEPFVWR